MGEVGDDREHLLRWFAPRHQRGYPPQRGLLLGKLTQPCLIGRITAYPPVDGMARTGAGVWRVHMTDASPRAWRAATAVELPPPHST